MKKPLGVDFTTFGAAVSMSLVGFILLFLGAHRTQEGLFAACIFQGPLIVLIWIYSQEKIDEKNKKSERIRTDLPSHGRK